MLIFSAVALDAASVAYQYSGAPFEGLASFDGFGIPFELVVWRVVY